MTEKITSADKVNLDGVTNELVFEILARLFDNKGFVTNIKSIRKRLGITVMSYEDAEKWLRVAPKEGSVHSPRSLLELLLSVLKQKRAIGDNLYRALQFVVLANCVTDKELPKVYCMPFPPETDDDFDYQFDYQAVAIIVHPETSKEDVMSAMDKQVPELLSKLYKKRKTPVKSSHKVRQYRDWYWLHKDMSYSKLYDHLEEVQGVDVPKYDTMIKAIQRYARKLR